MQQTLSTPLYLDWSFWAVIVAATAIVLSQLPPIYSVVRRGRLDMEVYSRMFINHKIGNPITQLYFILTNIGGRNIRINGIALTLKRDGKDLIILPAQNYLQDPNNPKTALLFTRFTLKSKEEWARMVNFFNYFSRKDENGYRSAQYNLQQNIFSKRQIPENKDRVVEADNEYVTKFINMFNEKFIWQSGEYEIQISVKTSIDKLSFEKSYRFTLFESDSSELSKSKNDYKLGDGIYWESGNHPGVIVQIIEGGQHTN
ncbi:MAG: hypothetical protein NTY36_18105 [Deltaproteobacteria bacterium]|nr:hypothetical protein [Deltaproteobacteria bacterium]